MRTKGRKSVALVGSVLAHVSVMIWGELRVFADAELPEIEIDITEVELLDPDALQGEVEKPPPKPQVVEPPPTDAKTPEPPTPEGDKEPEKSDDPEEPQRDLGKKRSKADELAPANSKLYALLVPKKVRKLKYAKLAVATIAPLPDFEYIIDGGGFDVLKDFDHVVIATPDVRSVTQTFIAVDHRKLSRDQMVAGIERAVAKNGEVIEWLDENGILRGNPRPADESEKDPDPRWFVLLPDHVAVYVRREFLPHIIDPETRDEDTSGNFVGNLTKLRTFAARQPAAGVQIVINKFRKAATAKNLPFEMPDGLEIIAEAAEEPEVLVRVDFATAVDAKAFEQWWKEVVPKLLDQSLTVKLMVGSLYEALQVERSGTSVSLWAQLDSDQIQTLLQLAADQSAKYQERNRAKQEEQQRKRDQAAPSENAPGPDEPAERPNEPAKPSETPDPPPTAM